MNEGLAEYYEGTAGKRAGFAWGIVRRDHTERIRRKRPTLKSFIYEGEAGFRARGVQGYSMGWALIYFLRKGGHADRFHKLFDELQGGAGPAEAMRRAFPEDQLRQLELEFTGFHDLQAR